MKNLKITFSKKQMQEYYSKNNITREAKELKFVFLNKTLQEIRERGLNPRCGIEFTITNEGKNLELLNISNATQDEVKQELLEVEDREIEFAEITEENERISKGNERLANASCHEEFMNAYKF